MRCEYLASVSQNFSCNVNTLHTQCKNLTDGNLMNTGGHRRGRVKKSHSVGRVREDSLNFLIRKSGRYPYLLESRGIT